MRYLVIGELKRLPAMPPDQIQELVSASVEAMVAQEKAGKIVVGGGFAGRAGGFGVVEAQSHEEVEGFFKSLPFWSLLDWEVIPLVSFEKRLEMDREILARLRAQKK